MVYNFENKNHFRYPSRFRSSPSLGSYPDLQTMPVHSPLMNQLHSFPRHLMTGSYKMDSKVSFHPHPSLENTQKFIYPFFHIKTIIDLLFFAPCLLYQRAGGIILFTKLLYLYIYIFIILLNLLINLTIAAASKLHIYFT